MNLFRICNNLVFIFILFCLTLTTNFAKSTAKADSTEQDFIVIDSHIHNGFISNNNVLELSNLEYFAQRHIHTFLLSLPVNTSKTENLYLRIKDEIEQLRLLSKETGMFRVVDPAKLINVNKINDKPEVVFCIEYFNGVFKGSLENLADYKNLGIRYITIIDNELDKIFERDSLSLFGKKLIGKMNEINVLIDISHLGDDKKLTVINYSNSPVIVSHSNARKIADINYNLSDKVLRRLSEKNGYVFVSFNKNGVYSGIDTDINAVDQLVKHIEYLVSFLGFDNVGIGSDYQANGKYIPQKLNEITAYIEIKNRLLRRGFSNDNIDKIMSNNILKLLMYTN